jgi:hypothetical protein
MHWLSASLWAAGIRPGKAPSPLRFAGAVHDAGVPQRHRQSVDARSLKSLLASAASRSFSCSSPWRRHTVRGAVRVDSRRICLSPEPIRALPGRCRVGPGRFFVGPGRFFARPGRFPVLPEGRKGSGNFFVGRGIFPGVRGNVPAARRFFMEQCRSFLDASGNLPGGRGFFPEARRNEPERGSPSSQVSIQLKGLLNPVQQPADRFKEYGK